MTALYALPDPASLPDYPISADLRLNNWFMQLDIDRWLGSRMRLLAALPVRAVYMDLLVESMRQMPVGTLPVDRRMLARLAQLPTDDFEVLCRQDPSPLHRWEPCRTDRGEVRLAHPVVTDMLLSQMAGREARAMRASADAERKRLDRLRKAMLEYGMHEAATKDNILVQRLDAWLSERFPHGRRGLSQYEAAFIFAGQKGWYGAGLRR
jgi:hypothetical protein